MTWYLVTRKDKYTSFRRRVKNKPLDENDIEPTHQEVYLGKHFNNDVDLPSDVLITAMNIYFTDISKPNKSDVLATLERIKSKRTGRKPVRITVNKLNNVDLNKFE
jgi:hypothetical protein